MRLCVVSFKECWQDETGQWYSYGGFPRQMEAIGSLFEVVTLVVVRGAPRAGGLPLPSGATVVPLRRPVGEDLRRKWSVMARLPYYLRVIGREMARSDVVHTPLPGDIAFIGLVMAIVGRKRLIARYGGSWNANTQTTLMNRVTRGVMRLFAGGRRVMLATGAGAAAPAARMSWIFATALTRPEIDAIRPSLDRALSNPPRLVYVGRLSPEKGVHVLIDALGHLRRNPSAPTPRLRIIGDGPERERLTARAAASGCADQVTFAGQLNRVELSRELLSADICVQPSLSEGFSKAWLDAFAHGLPVVASRVGAAASVLGGDGERGWLVSPGDPAQLAHALAGILTEPRDWAALRGRCRAYVAERTLEAWADQLAEQCDRQWGARLFARASTP